MSEIEQEQQTDEQTPEQVSEAQQVADTQQQVPEQKTEPDELETLKKRLADTQTWAHGLNQQLQEKRQREEAQRLRELESGLQPEVLDVVGQALEAREIRARQDQEERNKRALSAIYEVEPDIDALKNDPAFARALDEQAAKLHQQGKDPLNPIFAVKAVVEARKQYDMGRARQQVDAEDRARKASKLAAMDVPGSSANAAPAQGKSEAEQVAAVWNMSPKDFENRIRKARGF